MKQPFQYSSVEIQNKHHRLVLDYRSQNRIIQSETFMEAWNHASEDERKFMLNCFNVPNACKLKSWILKIMVGGLEQYPIRVLRQIASYQRIKNYSRMTKANLLDALAIKGVTNGSENSR